MVYIPRQPGPKSWLVKLIGAESAAKLASEFGGSQVALASPLLIFAGGRDNWVPASECQGVHATGADLTLKVYPTAVHSFDLDILPQSYGGKLIGGDPQATADSRERMLAFFQQNLSEPRKLEADAQAVENAPPGFAVPIHGSAFSTGAAAPPGLAQARNYLGCCSFLMRKGASLPVESFAAAHYIATLAFEAAQRVDRAQPPRPRLTPRQRDCMVLAAQGKSDWEIGKLLGISESTVHKHIEDAKRRFGVSTRIQLVVRSLFDARFSFSDVLK